MHYTIMSIDTEIAKFCFEKKKEANDVKFFLIFSNAYVVSIYLNEINK